MVVLKAVRERMISDARSESFEGSPDEISMQQMLYTRKGTERIIRYAFELAKQRGTKVFPLFIGEIAADGTIGDLFAGPSPSGLTWRDVGEQVPAGGAKLTTLAPPSNSNPSPICSKRCSTCEVSVAK